MSQQPPKTPLLLTVKEAAELLNCSASTTYKLIWSGNIPHIKLGSRTVRVPRQGLVDWIAQHQLAEPTFQG